jgi:hypothetical protein
VLRNMPEWWMSSTETLRRRNRSNHSRIEKSYGRAQELNLS